MKEKRERAIRKLCFLLLAVAMIVSLAACGNDSVQDSSNRESPVVSQTEKLPESSGEKEKENETQTNKEDQGNSSDIPADSNGLAEILTEVTNDYSTTITYLTEELASVYGTIGDTYNVYVSNEDTLFDWYELVLEETEKLYERTESNVAAYYKLVASIGSSDDDVVEDAMDEIYAVVYKDTLEELYDTIYEDTFDEIYEKYYEEILEDAKDSTDFGDWLDVRSDFYSEWLDSRSDFYGDWLDFRSDFYGDWLDIRGEFWAGNFDVDSFLKEIATLPDQPQKNEESPAPEPPQTSEKAPEEKEPHIPSEEKDKLVDGMRPEFKEAMDSYEAFYDEYCDFLQEYEKNPTDLKLIMEYAGMVSKLADMEEKFEEWEDEDLNNAEMKYYLEVNNRISQKLIDIAG